MAKTIKRKNPGAFRPGQDERRNVRGQVRGDTVALSALLKRYLTDEGCKQNGSERRTKAEALAAKIWERALRGEYQYVQFLADRIMGKVKDSIAIENENSKPDNEMVIRVVHVDDEEKELYRETPQIIKRQ